METKELIYVNGAACISNGEEVYLSLFLNKPDLDTVKSVAENPGAEVSAVPVKVKNEREERVSLVMSVASARKIANALLRNTDGPKRG